MASARKDVAGPTEKDLYIILYTWRFRSYIKIGIEVRQAAIFATWLRNLKDRRAVARIATRITRAQMGNLGDAKFFESIGELRIDYGPGYRLYLVRRGDTLIILLCGGDKSSQAQDIRRARQMAQEV